MTMIEKQIASLTREIEKAEKTVERLNKKVVKTSLIAEAAGMKISFNEWVILRDTNIAPNYSEKGEAFMEWYWATSEHAEAEQRVAKLTKRLEKMESDQMTKQNTIQGLLKEYEIAAIDNFLNNWETRATEYYKNEGKYDDRTAAAIKQEKIDKKLSLIYKVRAQIGKVIDGSGLRIGNDGNINGIIKGEKGSATVNTILAGGYNIQCLHYRVLVN